MADPERLIRVKAEDIETGESDHVWLGRGARSYVVTCGPDCYVAHTTEHANGTTVVTIKPTPEPEVPF